MKRMTYILAAIIALILLWVGVNAQQFDFEGPDNQFDGPADIDGLPPDLQLEYPFDPDPKDSDPPTLELEGPANQGGGPAFVDPPSGRFELPNDRFIYYFNRKDLDDNARINKRRGPKDLYPLPHTIVLDKGSPCYNRSKKKLLKADLHIKFNLGEDYEYGLLHPFTAKVKLKAAGFSSGSKEVEYEIPWIEIHNYSPEACLQIDLLEEYSLMDHIEIYTESFTADPMVAKDLELTFDVETEWGILPVNPHGPIVKLIRPDNWSANPQTFSWTSLCNDAPNYQFQLLRLYNTDLATIFDHATQTYIPTNLQQTVDWSRALTVVTDGPDTSITLTLAEGTGYYIWRVRPIGNFYEGGIADCRNWGDWSPAPKQGEALNLTIDNFESQYKGIIYYDQFDAEKNWIFKRTFNDSLKYKEGITYAGQLLQPKQEQSRIRSQDKIMTSGVVNDFTARPALQSMVLPDDKNYLGYKERFLRNDDLELYKAKDFDDDHNFEDPGKMQGDLRIFYTNLNPDPDVPTSGGYPFSRSLYYNDATEKFKETGNVGPDLQIGTGRTIRNMYSSVREEELIRVFGDEAPISTSVFKNIVFDPDNVATVNYIDQFGQTIASCHAVTEIMNEALIPLESRADAGFTVRDTVWVDHSSSKQDDVIKSVKDFCLEKETEVKLHYYVTPPGNEDPCATICFSCDYTIRIMLKRTDLIGDIVLILDDTLNFPGSDCEDIVNQEEHYTKTLPQGCYNVEKYVYLYNKDPNSVDPKDNPPGNTYLEEQKKALEADLRSTIDGEIGDALALLEKGDLDGFNEMMDIDPDAEPPQRFKAVDIGCMNLAVPVRKCGDWCDDEGNIKWQYMPEEILLRSHHLRYQVTGLNGYIFNQGKTIYPPQQTGEVFAEFETEVAGNGQDEFGIVIRSYGISDIVPDVELIPELLDLTGVDPDDVNAIIVEKINENQHLHHYKAEENGTKVKLIAMTGSLFNAFADIYSHPYTSDDDFVRIHQPGYTYNTSVHFNFDTGDDYFLGKGALDELFINMLAEIDADGDTIYDCNTLAQTWFVLFRSLYKSNSFEQANLLDMFLRSVGTMYQGMSMEPYGSMGYLTNAHKYFRDPRGPGQEGFLIECQLELEIDGDASDFTPEEWQQIKICMEGKIFSDAIKNGEETLPEEVQEQAEEMLPLDCMLEDEITPECRDAIMDQIVSQCDTICKMKEAQYRAEVYLAYEERGYVWENDIKTTLAIPGSPSSQVSVADIECIVRMLIDRCMDRCDLSRKPDEEGVMRLGTEEEVAELAKVLLGDIDIDLAFGVGKGYNCRKGYDLVHGSAEVSPVPQVELLKPALDEARDEMADDGVYEGWTSILNIVDQVYPDAGIGCQDPEFKIYTSEPIPGGVLSYFRINKSHPGVPNPVGTAINVDMDIIQDGCKLQVHYVFSTEVTPTRYGLAQFENTYTVVLLDTIVTICNDICPQEQICPVVCIHEKPLRLKYEDPELPCKQAISDWMIEQLEGQIASYLEHQEQFIDLRYENRCVHGFRDTLVMDYELGYYHYTLFYYDRAGNLVKTVPPKGVDILNTDDPDVMARKVHPNDSLFSIYTFNSMKQLVWQFTPDGDTTKFVYNNIGQLRFVQDARQKDLGKVTYFLYDRLGRQTQQGVVAEVSMPWSDFDSLANIPDWPPDDGSLALEQRNYQVYDRPAWGVPLNQRFLDGRLSYSYNDLGYKTVISYDPHGNAEWVGQEIPGLGFKHTSFTYELYGKGVYRVREISYQKDSVDQFFHRFRYDADNRLMAVSTSKDGVIWDKDASYTYYAHGPLKNIVLGEDKIQQLDYVWTLQGWLKAINRPADLAWSSGQDGSMEKIPRDAWGMTLQYFTYDFDRANSFLRSTVEHGLYSGNIAAWTHYTPGVPGENIHLDGWGGRGFRYDELGRLKESQFYTLKHNPNQPHIKENKADYFSTYDYDPNGNITKLFRNGSSINPRGVDMDDLTYHYRGNNNKLTYISDDIYSGSYPDDLEDWDPVNGDSYIYNKAGQLIKDREGEIDTIIWNDYGKVAQVNRTDGTVIEFHYDAQQERIRKIVSKPYSTTGPEITTYVRDGKGQVQAIYETNLAKGMMETRLVEVPIKSGSERIGLYKPDKVVKIAPLPAYNKSE